MKLRPSLLGCAFLLLLGPIAGAAAEPATAPSPTDSELAAILQVAPSPECDPAALPSPSFDATAKTHAPCGACSATACQGRDEGFICGIKNGQYQYCTPVGTCGGVPVTVRCSCGSGIAP